MTGHELDFQQTYPIFRRIFIVFVVSVTVVILLGCWAAQAQSKKRSWWSTFCERHLVADDEWPLSHIPNETLIPMFKWRPSSQAVKKEINFRARAGMLRQEDIIELQKYFLEVRK